jgi:hypothetical protein
MAVRSTLVVDRAFQAFDQLRAKAVLACASDAFYDNYNDFIYARHEKYRAASAAFRSRLLPFEEKAIARHFPSPPGTVLVGAAGGGREALALARRGYRVIAFEPSRPLATSLADFAGELPVETFVGRYEKLPVVNSLTDSSVDLRSRAPFAAAILGWGSFSHLRSDVHCIKTLREFGQLTRGPILVSFHSVSMFGPNTKAGGRFAMGIGYYRTFSGAEFPELAKRAGLSIIELNEDEDNYPYAVLRVAPTPHYTTACDQPLTEHSGSDRVF